MIKSYNMETKEWLVKIQNVVDYVKTFNPSREEFIGLIYDLVEEENIAQMQNSKRTENIYDKIRLLNKQKSNYRELYTEMKEQVVDYNRMSPEDFIITNEEQFINIYY